MKLQRIAVPVLGGLVGMAGLVTAATAHARGHHPGHDRDGLPVAGVVRVADKTTDLGFGVAEGTTDRTLASAAQAAEHPAGTVVGVGHTADGLEDRTLDPAVVRGLDVTRDSLALTDRAADATVDAARTVVANTDKVTDATTADALSTAHNVAGTTDTITDKTVAGGVDAAQDVANTASTSSSTCSQSGATTPSVSLDANACATVVIP